MRRAKDYFGLRAFVNGVSLSPATPSASKITGEELDVHLHVTWHRRDFPGLRVIPPLERQSPKTR